MHPLGGDYFSGVVTAACFTVGGGVEGSATDRVRRACPPNRQGTHHPRKDLVAVLTAEPA